MPTTKNIRRNRAARTVKDAVNRYKPRVLGNKAWRHAAGPVRAAVLATQPRTPGAARALLTALSQFLAWSRWDRKSSPHVYTLLTPRASAAFAAAKLASGAAVGTAEMYGRRLESIRAKRSVRARDTRVDRSVSASPTSPFLRTVTAAGPMHVVLAAMRRLDIAVSELTAFRLRPPLPAERDVPMEHPAAAQVDETVARHLWLMTHSTAEATMSATTPPGSTPRKLKKKHKAKRISNARAIREATAEHQRMLDLVRTDLVDPPKLPQPIQDAIDRYRPTTVAPATWHRIAPVVRLAATYYEPTTVTSARNVLSVAKTYVADLDKRTDRPVDITDVVSPVKITIFTEGTAAPQASRATYRTVLNRVARNATTGGRQTFAHRWLQPPYTQQQADALYNILMYQRTPALTRASCFLGACCLGAGQTPKDLRTLRVRDIEKVSLSDGSEVYVIHVTAAGRQRHVVVSARYAPMMRRALKLHFELGGSSDDVVLGRNERRAAITSPTTTRIDTGPHNTFQVNVWRMRSTWLVNAMQTPLSLVDLLRAAGLTSARSLVELAQFCTTPDEDHVDEVMRVLRDVA